MKSLIRHPSLNWILGIVTLWCFMVLANTAYAAVVATAKSPGAIPDVVTLHSEQGSICPRGALRATYFVAKTNETIEGCYVIKGKVVHVGFVDGDNGSLSVERFTWVGVMPSIGNDRPGVGPGRDTNGTPRPRTPVIAQRGGAKDAVAEPNWM